MRKMTARQTPPGKEKLRLCFYNNFIGTGIISKDGIYLIRKGLQHFCVFRMHGELSVLDG